MFGKSKARAGVMRLEFDAGLRSSRGGEMAYWVYKNTIHKKARIHDANCSFCSDGHGIHGGGKTISGSWYGPFANLTEAETVASQTKQPDIRGCNVCTGRAAKVLVTTAERPSPAPTTPEPTFAEWDSTREVSCSLDLRWKPVGRVSLDAGQRILFPTAKPNAGLYRFVARYPDGRFATYIGESDNLRRRFGNYRTPGPSQQTSLRINQWLRELLSEAGEVSVSIAEHVHLDGMGADLSRKATRRMFEQMAITLGHAEDIESLNR